ncbi:HK97 gp10 family phage protein [Virgibacillus halodenitrificans]|uniref:HK97 gp10 family phage protein n=1 Tax=Virgibacillus halodenitrificans TaxID=1482 RepID=UPI001FB3C50A|nr:HK97 gp10 family phage protein [Virgibacillus halodenitrificans]MCJ0932924.1 HK97 gp10 family phage protein [Virgibacillus halodenitrificans]
MARRANVSFGNKALQRALNNFGDEIIAEVKRIVAETTYKLYNEIMALIPVDDGNLRDSVEIDFSNDGLSARLDIGAEYAIYVNFGTGIYAEEGNGRKTPWVYWSNKLGRFVYTEGQKAQEFWGPSIDRASRFFAKEMKKLG